jgi:hypothetical protein
METTKMRKILGTLTALLAAGALAGFAIAGQGDGTTTYPGIVGFAGATAELEVSDGQTTLVAENLPEPRAGQVFQVWLMPKGSNTPQPTDVLFTPRGDGSVEAAIPSVDGVSQVLVTDEPHGGRDEPSGRVWIEAELS